MAKYEAGSTAVEVPGEGFGHITDGWGRRHVFKHPVKASNRGTSIRTPKVIRISDAKGSQVVFADRPARAALPKQRRRPQGPVWVAQCPFCDKRYGIFVKPLVDCTTDVRGDEIYPIPHARCIPVSAPA